MGGKLPESVGLTGHEVADSVKGLFVAGDNFRTQILNRSTFAAHPVQYSKHLGANYEWTNFPRSQVELIKTSSWWNRLRHDSFDSS